jgi:hypothetical protein
MGQHSSARAGSGQRRGWRRAAIVGIGLGFGFATVGVVGLASGTTNTSVYTAIAPVKVLGKSLAANSNTDIFIAGGPIVPSNATSLQLSVTALSGTTTSSMYVYPTGATKPTSANVRWQAGQTVTIPVTVAVGTSGAIRLTTDGGTVTVKVSVVGYFSPAAAPGSSGYATQSDNIDIADGSDPITTIASLSVPAGTYEVQAKGFIFLKTGTADTADCYLKDPTDAIIDIGGAEVDTDISEVPISMMGLDTTSGGPMTLQCYDIGSHAGTFNVELVAIQLSTATGIVTGG